MLWGSIKSQFGFNVFHVQKSQFKCKENNLNDSDPSGHPINTTCIAQCLSLEILRGSVKKKLDVIFHLF